MAAQQSQTATKLTSLGLVMLVGLLGACGALMLGGSDDPPPEETSCLPSQAAVANVTGSGTMSAAADEAVKAGQQQGIKVAVAISDAGKTDDALTVGEKGLLPSASVIKLAVALAAGKKVDAGTLTMDQVKPLLMPMIQVSDNNATNQLVQLIGGASEVNAQIRTLGVTEDQARLGRALGSEFSGADPNVLSIGGVSKMLQIIYDSDRNTGGGRKISQTSAAPIVSAMKAQQVNTKFGAVLPHDQIAHKTGELTGTSHDVGWFFDGERWLSVAILTSKASGDQAAGNEIIKKFAKKVFDARKEPVVGGAADRAPPSSSAAPSSGNASADGGAGEGTTMPIKAGDYQLSSPFGPRDGGMHNGSDFAAPLGTPIYAAHEGTVAASGPASGFGNWIIVDFNDGKASNVYGHMRAADLKVKTGDTVKAGQQIAAVGNEGQSSGPHLHFELWQGGTRLQGGHAVDPMPWLRGADQPSGNGGNVELVGAVDRGNGCGDVATGSTLKPGSVPAAFEPWIIKAGTVCPEITAPLIAAQTDQESGGFQVQATNPDSGAAGPGQFMAATWAAKGVDGDGDGKKDIYSIADAMMSMAHYDCELLGIMRDEMSAGKVTGDLIELTLSAYNCGPGATLAAGGPCQNSETQHYITIIPQRARTVYANPNADTPVSGAGFGGRVVAAAMKWRGTTYAWGGGTGKGPSMGIRDGGVADSFGDFQKIGFDCSGLVIHGVYQASGGKIELPHYTVSQLNDKRGKPVTGGQATWLPGDILFPAGGNPQHVAIYIGDGKVVEAPQSGDVVKVSPVASAVGANPDARRFG